MNPIHQWIEGKRNLKRYPVTKKMGRKSSRQLAIESYNKAIDDLIADSPSLLSAMEAEIRGKIGGYEKCIHQRNWDGKTQIRCSCILKALGGKNEEKGRIIGIIHEYFNHIRG